MVRQEILHLFLTEASLETHPRELARRLKRAAPPVVRELRALEERHILASRPVGPLRRYRLAQSREADAVRHLVERTPVPSPTGPDRRSHDGRLLALHARVADKLRQNPDRVMSKAYANLARWQQLDPKGNETWIRAWTEILARGPAEVALLLVDPRERMRELRQSSPFAGVLTNRERLQVLFENADGGIGR